MPTGHYDRTKSKPNSGMLRAGHGRNAAPPAIERPTLRDIAWAAGFYEGEGCAWWAGRTQQVSIAQKDRAVLDKLVRLFGGAVYISKKRKMHWYRISGARARGFMMTIYSWLSVGRQVQIKRALDCLPPNRRSSNA